MTGGVGTDGHRVRGAAVVGTVGGALALAGIVYLGWYGGVLSQGLAAFVYDVFLYVGLALIVVALAVWLSRAEAATPTAASWCLGGVAALFALAAWGNLDRLLAGDLTGQVFGSFVLAGNLGAVFGTVAGANRAQAERNAELVERTRTQREGLAFVNNLLRHHVLNGVNIIEGQAAALAADLDEDEREQLEVIEDQSERIVTMVENVRTLVRSLSEPLALEPIDLSALLRAEVESVRGVFPDATVRADLDDGVSVRANELASAMFSNLLTNAVEHNDAPDPAVEVTLRADDDTATVTVADDGPGIPDRRKEAVLEERATGVQSLGLYLVVTLVEQYGGEVDVRDNEPRGTVVAVELSRAGV